MSFFTRDDAYPHLKARLNALEMTPAILRTDFALRGRAVVDLRRWPPDFISLTHSLLRCSAYFPQGESGKGF